MSLIAKVGSVQLDSARRCLLLLPPYGEVEPLTGEPIFIWISETKGGQGLSYRGEIEASGDGAPLPLVARISEERPIRQLTKADLAQAPGDGGPLATLADKLYRHSLHKVATLTADEAEFLESFFSSTPEAQHELQREDHRRWWAPVLEALQTSGERPPRLYWPNNVRLPLPWSETWVTVYVAGGEDGKLGVFVGGSDASLAAFWQVALPKLGEITALLPVGVTSEEQPTRFVLKTVRHRREFENDQAQQAWLIATAGAFAQTLRPTMRRLLDERGDPTTAREPDGAWTSKGVLLPQGTSLRMRYNGREFTGVIDRGQFLVDGHHYTSPSAAARAVAITRSGKRTNLNGWVFWEARCPGASEWSMLDELYNQANPRGVKDGETLLHQLGLLDD